MPNFKLYIPDIHCDHCKMRISKALKDLGLRDFEISVADKVVILQTQEIEKVIEKLKEIDYPPQDITKLTE
ncbi:MAG: heavy-metal-associated domain-containing protein [Candidatus Hydrothermia bacterium]